MAGLLQRIGDFVRGETAVGRTVDRAAPNATPSQRRALIQRQTADERFLNALGETRTANRFIGPLAPGKSWATDFSGRARMAGLSVRGPRTMASSLAYVRHQARHCARTNPHALHAIRILTDWAIGDGINRSFRASSKAVQRRLDETARRWFFSTECDVARRHTIYGLERLIYRTFKTDGEVIIRLRPRKVDDGLAVPLAIEVLEGDYLYDGPRPAGVARGNVYSAGIEFAPIGHPVAYWLYKGHPDDGLIDRTPVRVPVVDAFGTPQILHYVDVTRAGQIRGEPRAAIALETVYGQRDLRLSTLERMRAQSRILHWLTSKTDSGNVAEAQTAYGFDGADAYNLDTGEVVDRDAVPAPSEGRDPYEIIDYVNGELLADGTVVPLPSGVDVKESTITTPADYGPIMTDMHREVAVAFGVPYELLTGDLSKINFSSWKAGSNQFKADLLASQGDFIDVVCAFIWTGFAIAGERAGLWSASAVRCEHRANAFPSVEPQKDIGTTILKMRHGLISPRRAAAELGEDLDELVAEIAEDKAKLEALGIDIWGALKALTTPKAKDVGASPPVT